MPGPIEINRKYNYDRLDQYSLGTWAGSLGHNGEPAGHPDVDWFTYDYDGPQPNTSSQN